MAFQALVTSFYAVVARVYKAPKYIKELLVLYKPRRHLRSEAKGFLDEPRKVRISNQNNRFPQPRFCRLFNDKKYTFARHFPVKLMLNRTLIEY